MRSETPQKGAAITLREVTRETVVDVIRLKVAPEQERFVAPNAVSIAQAHFQPESAWFRGIYADDTLIGFVMLEDQPDKPEYGLWRFMIDHRFQGMGFGSRALDLLFEHVRTRPGATELIVSVVPGEGGPGAFYERMGFRYTGAMFEDRELVMRREL